MKSTVTVVLLLSIICIESIHALTKDQEATCAKQSTCQSCLQTPNCVWCALKNSSGHLIRCASREKFMKDGNLWCESSDVIDEQTVLTMIEDRPLSSSKDHEPVQVQPQHISLRLRRGVEHRVTLKYSQAEDYPVDLYYLMDLSASMEPYRDNLSVLGLRLAEAMRKLTSNFRLGFGSFVDKVVLPMTSTQKEKLASPCVLDGGAPCAPPYGFKNQMPLTEDVMQFKSRVMKAPVSGNLDAPEGGLDAIMQAVVCTEEIGWRQKARHLIIFSTDASFHIAGDGRLAGIIEPNDCKCHLNEHGFYDYSLLQDYPSIAQIDRVVQKHNMNIIFAVPSHKNTTYQMLSRSISGSSSGTLENDSQNVVELVSGEYEKLVDSVTITANIPKMVDIKFFSRCLNKTEELQERQECGGLRVGNVIEFEVVLKVIECPANPSEWKQTVQIKPQGINESLIIDLELICDCDCNSPSDSRYELNSTICNNNGVLSCGVCECNEGYNGKHCECEGDEKNANSAVADCKPDNTTIEDCSGHGVCMCGVCSCFPRPNAQEIFYGTYCECDNFSCKRSGGEICGGRGKCDCGTCLCPPGWTGETCECKESNSTCIAPSDNDRLCNGRGDCKCGVCHCHEKDNIRYSGVYCEECPTCPGQKCDELKDCVECVAYNAGPLSIDDKCAMCLHQIDIVDKVEEDPEKDQVTGARFCRTPGDAGCTFVFKYEFYRGGSGGDIKVYKIQAEKERSCPTPVNIYGVALGVIATTVVIGFLSLLIWKILTSIHDRREYAKFEKERASAKWNREENPLYKQATSTFNNPMFHEHT